MGAFTILPPIPHSGIHLTWDVRNNLLQNDAATLLNDNVKEMDLRLIVEKERMGDSKNCPVKQTMTGAFRSISLFVAAQIIIRPPPPVERTKLCVTFRGYRFPDYDATSPPPFRCGPLLRTKQTRLCLEPSSPEKVNNRDRATTSHYQHGKSIFHTHNSLHKHHWFNTDGRRKRSSIVPLG